MEDILKVGDEVLITDLYKGLQKSKVIKTTPKQAIIEMGGMNRGSVRIPITGGYEIPNYSNRHNRHIHTYYKFTPEKERELLQHYKYFKK